MFSARVQLLENADLELLEKWRNEFASADLELPEGWSGEGVATATARTKDGELLGSLTATLVNGVTLDPLLLRPGASRTEALAGLFALTNSLEYQAQLNGAVASFIAVPNLLPDYQSLVLRCGFQETAQHCKLFRRSLRGK